MPILSFSRWSCRFANGELPFGLPVCESHCKSHCDCKLPLANSIQLKCALSPTHTRWTVRFMNLSGNSYRSCAKNFPLASRGNTRCGNSVTLAVLLLQCCSYSLTLIVYVTQASSGSLRCIRLFSLSHFIFTLTNCWPNTHISTAIADTHGCFDWSFWCVRKAI